MPRFPNVTPDHPPLDSPSDGDGSPVFEEPALQEPGPDVVVLAAGASAYYQFD